MSSGDGRLRDRFVRLCEIESPTGSERAVADAVLAELAELGVEAVEDEAAGPARAGAGNLVARLPGTSEKWLMLCAHLDTVPHDGPIEVGEQDGVFRSRGDTILGADNKAAVAVLLELAARHAGDPAPMGLELVFTVAEEDGLRGAKELESPRFAPDSDSFSITPARSARSWSRRRPTSGWSRASAAKRLTPGSTRRTAGARSSRPPQR